ncbi:MAG: cupredoxin domain-containing protein [Rhizomicrobium sp.]
MKKILIGFVLTAMAAISPATITPAGAADAPIVVHLKNHKFTPSVIKVKANKPSMIILYNDDASADEFDSPSLKIERVVPGGKKANIRVRALAPGKYPFMGEFNAATAQGVVIAE